MVWELTGAVGLTNNGWKRLESKSHPGKFYYLHETTGRTVIAPTVKDTDRTMPAGWERRESKSRPGTFYFVNLKTGETSAKPPPSEVTRARPDEEAELDGGPASVAAAAGVAGFAGGGGFGNVQNGPVWPWQQQGVGGQATWPWQA
mmetsp:Transcript_26753/g.86643  ORF Transcript_26753/g.86643 Transcript_26753/m.86643 type:complete len:146 (+) Transcript_26753:1147-1584(+)